MADQKFLASFGVEIDESGLDRLQKALKENRTLAEQLASAFDRLWDGTYTLDDLLDAAELIQVRYENEARVALIRTRTAEL